MKLFLATSIAILTLLVSVSSNGDDRWTPQKTAAERTRKALSKTEYMHRAYVLRQGVRPPEGFTGTWRTWHKNGKPQCERPLVNGVDHGTCKEWDVNGKRIATGTYRNGKKIDGSFRNWYYRDGDIAKHCYNVETLRASKCDGPCTDWTADGRKLVEGRFAGDKRHGVWKWWNGRGQLIADGTYKNGHPWSGSFVVGSGAQRRVVEYEAGKIDQ